MLVPLRWLREYVDFDLSPSELAELLTMTGTKVEAVTKTGEALQGIISARIVSLEQHPQEPRWKIARLQARHDAYTIVTAAQNVRVGDMVPLAVPGSTIADGRQITEALFQGTVSEGMMCSAMELGISDDADGILILSGSCLEGLDLVSVLELKDDVLELEITPNRPDCLGIIGVAREVAAITGGSLRWPDLDHIEKGEPISSLSSAKVLDPDYCSRYALKLFSDVKVGPSSIWMQVRLKAAGIRPISNIVDVTNYVMLDLNQPLHAFDYDLIEGGRIIVRRARQGESVMTLDGQERPVEAGMLLICDAVKPVAIAGVMGGAESEIGDKTKRVLLESANFLRQSVWRTSKSLKLRTESSLRFEKGLDPETAPVALRRSANLLGYMGAASAHPGIIDVRSTIRAPKRINTTRGWISAKLGTELGSKIDDYLTLIGMEVEAGDQDDRLTIGVPSWRDDIEAPIDLAEEVARLHGYDELNARVPLNDKPSSWTEEQISEKRIKEALLASGLHEAMTYSMVAADDVTGMRIEGNSRKAKAIVVSNPLSEDQSVMRTLLLPSLLRVASLNHRRGNPSVRAFELARAYLMLDAGLPEGELLRGDKPCEEVKMVSGVLSGAISGDSPEKSWLAEERQMDFYDIKGVVETMLSHLSIDAYEIKESEAPYLRPGRRADLIIDGRIVGSFGQLHPDTAVHFEVPETTVGFEIEVAPLIAAQRHDMKFKGIPRFPSTVRDIALVADRALTSEQIRQAIMAEAGDHLESVLLFDVYEGSNIPQGKRSLAFTLKYRAKDRTLTTEEVNRIHDRVREKLNIGLGLALR